MNKQVPKRLLKTTLVGVGHMLALFSLERILPGFTITRLWTLLIMPVGLGFVQSGFWWMFVNFFSRLPFWLYPVITTVVNGFFIFLLGHFLPGIVIEGLSTAIWILVTMTIVNTLVSSLFPLQEGDWFDRSVIRGMIERIGKQKHTDVPGFLFLEIDGLSEELFRRALENGTMPTLKKWVESGSHQILGWETDFSSQTAAMQFGILMGRDASIPAYRWWDREQGKLMLSGLPSDAQKIEEEHTNGEGLCNHGGSSRGNMFSGDASESLFTVSTLLNRSRNRGPGFYFYLINPYVVIRLVTRFLLEVVKEWGQALWQRVRRPRYRVSSRNFKYAFLRGFMSPVLQDLSTYAVVSDVLRGLPAIYACYAGYDDIAHYTGMYSSEAKQALKEIDQYFERIERALQDAPRPYHLVVLSDHGQCFGQSFQAAHGLKLDDLVKGLIDGEATLVGALDTNEAWDNLNAFLNESLASPSRTAEIFRRALVDKTKSGVVRIGPEKEVATRIEAVDDGKVVVLASGCAGLIYFTAANERLTQEQIQDAYPNLLLGLIDHPGIGFAMLHSAQYGPVVIGKRGVLYLKDGKIEGVDPLKDYGVNAARHLLQGSSYENCPDILLNTTYNPVTQEISAFENQVSHHGGLGGLQNLPFILHPTEFQTPDAPIVGAKAVYQLLRGWRDIFQPVNPHARDAEPLREGARSG